MKKAMSVISLILVLVLALSVFTACDSSTDGGSTDSTPKDAVAGTWKQTDKVDGNWTWTFDGKGKCTLEGETTGFKGEGTYKLDETAKTLTVNIEGWSAEKVFNYTLTDTNLDMEETYASYHLVKQ